MQTSANYLACAGPSHWVKPYPRQGRIVHLPRWDFHQCPPAVECSSSHAAAMQLLHWQGGTRIWLWAIFNSKVLGYNLRHLFGGKNHQSAFPNLDHANRNWSSYFFIGAHADHKLTHILPLTVQCCKGTKISWNSIMSSSHKAFNKIMLRGGEREKRCFYFFFTLIFDFFFNIKGKKKMQLQYDLPNLRAMSFCSSGYI